MDSTFSLTIVAITAFLPGITAWWTGRHLARLTDDPALPELLLSCRQRALKIFAGSLAVMLVLGGRHSAWGVPLLLIALAAGNYPLRRKLGLVTGSFALYALASLKSLLGGLGFWLLLVTTPQIVFSIDWPWRLLTIALVPLLLAWEHWHPRIWLWMHDAAPLDDPDIVRRIDAIVQRAGTPAPPVYRVGGKGIRFANAVAIPSARHPAIGLGNGLIELLEPDEVAAIYAHELSHHEQHTPRSLRRAQAVNRALILLAVGFPFAAASLIPTWRWPLLLTWPVLLVFVLAHRGRKRKQHETESDLRAAALCGDAELVARALVKLHVHALIPRRWPVDLERGATHPSLARRIQALRGSAGVAAATASRAPVVIKTSRAGTVVVFDDERAHWFDGVPADTPGDIASLRTHATSARSVVWPELVELRVAASGAQRTLKATHRNGDTWSVPLDPKQVSAVQEALDRVDVHLHRELGRRTLPDARLIAVIALLVMLWSGDMGVVLVPAGLTALWPSTAALAALGMMTIASALMEALRSGSSPGEVNLSLVLLAAVGLFALWRVSGRMKAPTLPGTRDDIARRALLVLGGLAAILTVVLVIAAVDAPAAGVARLPMVPALAIALGGLAAALYTRATRRDRMAAGVLAAAGFIVAIPPIRAADVFSTAHRLSRTHVTAHETGRVALPRTASDVRLSPDGLWFLARHYEVSDDEQGRFVYTVGSPNEKAHDVSALQAEFVGDHRLLALRRVNDTLALELQDVQSPAVLWRQVLPSVSGPRLAASPHEQTWVVSGIQDEGNSPIVVAGSVGSSATTLRHLRRADAGGLAMGGVVSIGKRMVIPAYNIDRSFGLLTAFGLEPLRVGLWEIDDASRRQIGEVDGVLECGAPDGGYALCLVRQRSGTEVWTLGPVGQPSLVTKLPLLEVVRSSLGPGRRMTSVTNGKRVIIVDAAAGRIADVDVSADSAYAMSASSMSGRLAVLWRGDAGTSLAFYSIP